MIIKCRRHRDRPQALIQLEVDTYLRQTVQRKITFDRHTNLPIRQGWHRPVGGFECAGIGVYCAHCAAEGRLESMDLDPAELRLLGRAAHLFTPPNEVQIEQVWPELQRRYGKLIVDYRDAPHQGAAFLSPRTPLPAALQAQVAHVTNGRNRMYRHQAEAIDAAQSGQDVVVVTPTASGKSLCYVVPVLARLMRDPQATALYLAPTQALAEDQMGHWTDFSTRPGRYLDLARTKEEWQYLRDVHLGDAEILLARYDGGTQSQFQDESADLRRRIRGLEPRVIITTPEMLHTAMLPNSHLWQRFFRNLAYVVIDELHVYTGLFGSSVVQVLRRLTRLCDQFGTRPQFIACSATIRNPQELAEALISRPVTVIGPERDGSPRHRRRFVLLNSGFAEEPVWATARNLMTDLIRRHRLRTICFTRSTSETDSIYQMVQQALDEFDMKDLVKQFKAILPHHERQSVARALQSGRSAGVITTNALELGVDIGPLSACIMVKFPGSISSLFQQAGRSGRRGEGLIFMLADENPLNQFYAQHPEEFFAMTPEEVYLDPDQSVIAREQILCAAVDQPLVPDRDAGYWGPSWAEAVASLTVEGLLRPDSGALVPAQDEYYPAKVGLRNKGFFQVPILHQGVEIAKESGDRAARTLHPHARLRLQDAMWEVSRLTINYKNQSGRAEVRMVRDHDYYTVPATNVWSEVVETLKERQMAELSLAYGVIDQSSRVIAYYEVPVPHQRRGSEPSEERPIVVHQLGPKAPPARTITTKAVWIALPAHTLRDFPPEEVYAGLNSMQKALVLAACIYLRCDPGDLDGAADAASGRVYLFDSQAGGTGLAAKAYVHMEQIWPRAWRLLNDCPFCSVRPESRGCPKCVTVQQEMEEQIDRRIAIQLFATNP